MAIAAGICDGLGFGDNTRAVLITRGLAELGRLGFTLGGKVLTFGGLAGVGDLVATCASPKSRNRTVGFALGEGRSLDDIVNGMHMVAEGVKSAGPLVALARAHGVEMPIAEQVESIVRRHLLAQGSAHEPDEPTVAARVGRDPAARAADMTDAEPGGYLTPTLTRRRRRRGEMRAGRRPWPVSARPSSCAAPPTRRSTRPSTTG